VKFKYKFQIVGDGKHGNINPVTGEWNGMIRELQDQVKVIRTKVIATMVKKQQNSN
jgi:hypothetical protein